MRGIEGVGVCPRCGAPVFHRLTMGDRRYALDAEPAANGNVTMVTIDGRERARVLTGPEMPAQEEAFTIHACPKATPGPPCAVCRRPMHAELARELGWTTHPACDSEYGAEVARLALKGATA